MKIKLCIWCHKNPAVVPAVRGNMGRFKEEICSECHAKRLRGDLVNVLRAIRTPPRNQAKEER